MAGNKTLCFSTFPIIMTKRIRETSTKNVHSFLEEIIHLFLKSRIFEASSVFVGKNIEIVIETKEKSYYGYIAKRKPKV